jgi:hypothetical protein
MDAFKVKIEDKEYSILPIQEKDQFLYEVSVNDLVYVIGLNENAGWESTADIDDPLVQKIGNAIEDHER